MSGTPLIAMTLVDDIAVAVTSAYGGPGALVENTRNSTSVRLINTGSEPIEYRVDTGPWLGLEVRTQIPLAINLASTQLRLRMSQFARAGSAQLAITSLTGTYAAGDDTVDLGREGEPPPPGFANPMTTLNDLICGGEAGEPTRLSPPEAKGSYTLKCVDGVMSWVPDEKLGDVMPVTLAAGA